MFFEKNKNSSYFLNSLRMRIFQETIIFNRELNPGSLAQEWQIKILSRNSRVCTGYM